MRLDQLLPKIGFGATARYVGRSPFRYSLYLDGSPVAIPVGSLILTEDGIITSFEPNASASYQNVTRVQHLLETKEAAS